MYFDFISRISECAKDGNEILLLLSVNVLISLVSLVIQCVWIFRAWRSRNSARYGLQVELKKNSSRNEGSDQQDMDPQEANPLTMEMQEAVSSDIGLQGAAMQDLGFDEGIPGWMRYSLINTGLRSIHMEEQTIYLDRLIKFSKT